MTRKKHAKRSVSTDATPRFFKITYSNGKRFVKCDQCKRLAEGSIVTHFKKEHPKSWKEIIETFLRLRKVGYSSKKIMRHFGRAFSWTVIERELAQAGAPAVPSKKKIITLEPESFTLEPNSIWSFETRGNWANHDSSYRGNWAPEIPRNLILRYSREGDWILDPFVGGGTTAIECYLLGRNCIGYDVNKSAIALSRQKVKTLRVKSRGIKYHNGHPPDSRLYKNDARNMHQVQSGSIQLVCAHPPYLDIVEYTRKDPADLSTITDPHRFVREMQKISYEVFRCLKPEGIFCILVGDARRNGKFIPLGFQVLEALLDSFDLVDIIIKAQHQCSNAHFWQGKDNKFLRLAHEYLFVLRKPLVGGLIPR